MANTNQTQENTVTQQYVLSHELLLLLQWLLEYDTPKLKKLVSHALKSGLRAHLNRASNNKQELLNAQHSVLEFFGTMEALLIDSMNEQAVQAIMEKKLMPAIDQIDAATCDGETIRQSIEKTAARLELHPDENPHDALFSELLKQWKPKKKMAVN